MNTNSRKISVDARSQVIRRQIIEIDIAISDIDPDVDFVVIEVPLMFGRVRRMTIPIEAVSNGHFPDPTIR